MENLDQGHQVGSDLDLIRPFDNRYSPHVSANVIPKLELRSITIGPNHIFVNFDSFENEWHCYT